VKKLDQAGLTIVELTIAMAIAVILAGVVLAINLNFFGSVSQSRITAELAIESNFVLQTMVEDIRLADGIAANNSLTDANAPVGGWVTSDLNNVIVIQSPAIDSNHDVIYDPNTGFPYRNEIIYFIDGSKLYKRVLKNTNAPSNTAVTTCPASVASSTCPVDKEYTTYITDLGFTYYNSSGVATTDPTLARSVKANLIMSRKSFGKTITFNNSIQTTLRNY
jgi:Tfp pilus assembly protein PilW